MNLRYTLCTALTATIMIVAASCAGDDHDTLADLPEGWEGAAHIEHFVQSACTGSPYDGSKEVATFSSAGERVHIDYEPAHFRCDQDVEAFMKVEAAAVDVLVQPVDMDPSSIAKCDCLYTIEIEFPIERGRHQLTLYRRWDHQSGADEPLKIGSESVDSP